MKQTFKLKKILGDKLAVQMLEEKLSDTLEVVQNYEKSGPAKATVVCVGTSVRDIKVGDTVLVRGELGARLPDDKTRIYLMEDVLCIL